MPQDMTGVRASATDQLFELTAFLEGRTRAWGVFEDRFGRVQRRLSVEMHGRWEGLEFVLDERFSYDTGDTETRTWRVLPIGHGRFEATCPDCVGKAVGQSDADSIRMSYDFRLKLQSREIVVTFDDRIYRITPSMAVNRARMSKWGIRLGELSLFFERVSEAAA